METAPPLRNSIRKYGIAKIYSYSEGRSRADTTIVISLPIDKSTTVTIYYCCSVEITPVLRGDQLGVVLFRPVGSFPFKLAQSFSPAGVSPRVSGDIGPPLIPAR